MIHTLFYIATLLLLVGVRRVFRAVREPLPDEIGPNVEVRARQLRTAYNLILAGLTMLMLYLVLSIMKACMYLDAHSP